MARLGRPRPLCAALPFSLRLSAVVPSRTLLRFRVWRLFSGTCGKGRRVLGRRHNGTKPACHRVVALPIHNLDKLFYPCSVAVVGATNQDNEPGTFVMHNLLQGGFDGRLIERYCRQLQQRKRSDDMSLLLLDDHDLPKSRSPRLFVSIVHFYTGLLKSLDESCLTIRYRNVCARFLLMPEVMDLSVTTRERGRRDGHRVLPGHAGAGLGDPLLVVSDGRRGSSKRWRPASRAPSANSLLWL